MGFSGTPANPPVRSGEEWKAKNTYAAAQAAANEVKAAPSATQSLYVESLLVSSDTIGWIQVVYDTAGAATELIPKIYLPANGSGELIFIAVKVRVPAGKNLGVKTGIAGNHSVMFTGYTN